MDYFISYPFKSNVTLSAYMTIAAKKPILKALLKRIR